MLIKAKILQVQEVYQRENLNIGYLYHDKAMNIKNTMNFRIEQLFYF